jgi:hypothetical protein
MKLSELENVTENQRIPFQAYEKIYAQRHKLPTDWVRQNPRLQLAAILEWQVATHTITVPHARRLFVKEYPDSNRLPVPKTVYEEGGYFYHDEKYALGSVLNLIMPYEDSIREVKGL